MAQIFGNFSVQNRKEKNPLLGAAAGVAGRNLLLSPVNPGGGGGGGGVRH